MFVEKKIPSISNVLEFHLSNSENNSENKENTADICGTM